VGAPRVTTLEQLRDLAERLPVGGALTLPRDVLLEALGGTQACAAAVVGDLTVADVASRVGRKPSTVRGWLEAGRFTGAYKLNGRDWRVPAGSLTAFLDAQRTSKGPQRLSDWRRSVKRAS